MNYLSYLQTITSLKKLTHSFCFIRVLCRCFFSKMSEGMSHVENDFDFHGAYFGTNFPTCFWTSEKSPNSARSRNFHVN